MFFNLVYCIGLMLVSPIVLYRAVRHGRYRQGIREKLLGLSRRRAEAMRGSADQTIWLHAVSVGEAQLLPTLVQRVKQAHRDAAIVISCSTDTGIEVARKHFGRDGVFFCPLDFTWAVRRTLRNLNCQTLILVELELWPNLIRLATNAGCRVVVVNGRLSQRSADNYHRFAKVLAPTFARLAAVGCQTEEIGWRFVACGVRQDRVCVTGSLKYDNAPSCRETAEVTTRVNWSGAEPWHRVWCFGSTQEGEEKLGLEVYGRLSKDHPELRLILVPRHAERFDRVAHLIEVAGYRVIRRSRRRSDSQYRDVWEADEVLLVDTVGELRAWWGVASIATVGGSFGNRGGQNMLEPAGYGSAVSFGLNTRNFADIADELVARGGAVRVTDAGSLQRFVTRCLDDVPAADALGRAAQQVVQAHRGAHDRTIEMLRRFNACTPILSTASRAA